MSQVTHLINYLKTDEMFEIYQHEIDTLIVNCSKDSVIVHL